MAAASLFVRLHDALDANAGNGNALTLFRDASQSARNEWAVIGLDVDADVCAARVDVKIVYSPRSLAMVQKIGLWLSCQSSCHLMRFSMRSSLRSRGCRYNDLEWFARRHLVRYLQGFPCNVQLSPAPISTSPQQAILGIHMRRQCTNR